MANLGPLYQNQTYGNLLQVDGGLTAELKPVLDGDGNESGLTLSLTGVGISGLVAASASNLNAGLAGTVPYQIAPNITGFTTVGTSGYVLASTGVGAPIWTNTVPNSTYSSLAVDVSGGAAGQVLYQSDANNTSFTGVGTLGQVLVSGGAAAPYWSTSVPAAGVAGSASNISGGVSGNLLYQADVGLTHYVNNGTSGQLLRSQGSAAPVWATVTAADVGSLPLDGSTAMTGNLSMGSHTITNLLNPLASTDAANKAYVDSVATGLKIKSACRVASTTDLVLSGLIAVDGVTVNNADRVLVKNQSFQDQNGIYVASASSWTRATDADTWEELTGATCFITEGSTQANTTWACNITAGGTIGVTPITFVLFGASASYTAGTGLTLVGSQFALATPVSVANGGSGVTTLTGIIKGNGSSAFTAATGADVVSLIGATAVQNATTAGSCSGNALTATTLQTARTINGVSFNGSANITVTANTTGSLNVVSNGLGDAAPFSFNGSVTRDLSYNSIGAAAVSGSNATGTWPISITGNAANISGIVGTVNGGTGYASYAIGDLLYASAPTVLSKLPIGSSDRILRSTGSVPSWGQVELNTTVVTGTLPPTRGGTGIAAPFGTLGAVYVNTSTTMTTGILPVAYGGTGTATLTGYVKGNGTGAMTASLIIPNTDVSGLGTLSTQNANVVTITGGTINGTSIGATTASTGSFSNLTTSGTVSLNGYITVDAGAAYLLNPRIRDSSQNNWYRITPSELALDVYTFLPALTGNDTFVFQNHTQTLTNKTLTSPTISGGTITGITDLAIADGGTNASTAAAAIWNLTNELTGRAASKVLTVNSGNTALEWTTPAGSAWNGPYGGYGYLPYNNWFEASPPIGRAAGSSYANGTFLTNSTAQNGIFCGTKSSFVTTTDPAQFFNCIGQQVYAINDLSTAGVTPQTAYCAYWEARKYNTSGARETYCIESDIANYAAVVPFNPYSSSNYGISVNHWLGSGIGGNTNSSFDNGNTNNPCTAGVVFLSNGGVQTSIAGCSISGYTLTLPAPNANVAVYQRIAGVGVIPGTIIVSGSGTSWTVSHDHTGSPVSSQTVSFITNPAYHRGIVFNDGSLSAGTASDPTRFEAITMPQQYKISWYRWNSGGTPGAWITGYDRGPQYANVSSYSLDLQATNSSGTVTSLSLHGLSNNSFAPYPDNTISLGNSVFRFTTVYATTGTINTSDERLKDIRANGIDACVLEAWSKVQYEQFKWKDAIKTKGDGARWHIGLIAQRVKDAFESEGLDPFDYGLLCYDEWDDDHVEGIEVIAGNRYGIRYEEALALECAYLRSKLEALTNG